jgi:hypothetical protein
MIANRYVYDYSYASGSGTTAYFGAKYVGTLGNSLRIAACDSVTGFNGWALSGTFQGAPGTSTFLQSVKGSEGYNDEIHIAVVDAAGKFSGISGSVLEVYESLSKASDARKSDGSSNYYKNVLNDSSAYVYWLSHIQGLADYASSSSTFGMISATASAGGSVGLYRSTFAGGSLGNSLPIGSGGVTADDIGLAYSAFFGDSDTVDIGLLLGGALTGTAAQYVCNVASTRKDCVAFVSVDNDASIAGYAGSAAQRNTAAVGRSTAMKNLIGSNSYAFIDSGY